MDCARDLSRELCNALRHHVTQQQLDPSASYKKKLSEEDFVGGREESSFSWTNNLVAFIAMSCVAPA